jgi:peptide/nickel transport system permease protein
VEAARAAATSELKILFVEILPHIISASVVYSVTIVGPIVILAAGLSFLGLGVQQPTAEWGMMTATGRLVLYKAPHESILPGVAIFLLVVAINLLGDGLRDSLDPRTRLRTIERANKLGYY